MLILASSSKRRIELLKDANLKFKVVKSNLVEKNDLNLKPHLVALENAKLKCLDVFNKNKESTIIAADTVVAFNDKIYGKPKNNEDAFNTLKTLSNNTHLVITAVCIKNKEKEELFYETSKVTFKDLSDFEILNYINTKEPFGKAGSYAIQGIGKNLVKKYEGDFFNIVGLPLKKVLEKLKEF